MLAKPSEAMHPCLVSETTGFKGTEKLLTARQVVDLWPDAGLTRSQLWRWAREGLISDDGGVRVGRGLGFGLI